MNSLGRGFGYALSFWKIYIIHIYSTRLVKGADKFFLKTSENKIGEASW